ncbi:hypothetical protein L596_022236 [Steinernema carpocapsae]|uniref:Uncharacterized protein n=1 Tax=Steinernema carpocapsae TaxID=34508 RepID=A0A4U5ML85_STECR|nr:hypothetical protein L596_022236 [Steinernema carpocapsae]
MQAAQRILWNGPQIGRRSLLRSSKKCRIGGATTGEMSKLFYHFLQQVTHRLDELLQASEPESVFSAEPSISVVPRWLGKWRIG